MSRRPPALALFALFATIAAIAGCGDNAELPDAPSPPTPDGPPRKPDLVLRGDEMAESVQLVATDIPQGACELVEECVGGPGTRMLLQFDTIVANDGDADLVIGKAPPRGVSEGRFVWSDCHMHHHVGQFAEYELRDATGVVMAGHKQAFCLADTRRERLGALDKFTCDDQGLTAGYADIYQRGISCQWIDVTTVTPGTYTLVVRINSTDEIDEKDRTNNEWQLDGIVIGSVE